jgi:Domain of unknown function (DUF4388)
MADAFPLSGNIDPKTFPFLLVDLYRRGATGSLKVEGPTHPKALYFRGGRVLFGSSNDPKDQLGAILIENGKITQEQLDDVNTKVGPGNPLAKVLAESGYVNQRELGEAARIKVERILSDLIAYETGSFEFEDGVLPKGAVDLKLSTEKLLLAAVARMTDRAFVLRHLESLGIVLAAAPDWDSQVSEIRGEAGSLLERLDGQRSLKEAVALTRFDEFEGAKLACGLLFLGLARKSDASAAPAEDELDLGDTASAELAPGVEDGSASDSLADNDAPFFTQDSAFAAPESPFVEPTQSPELPSIPYSPEPEAPVFAADEPEGPPIEGLLAEPASTTVVMPSIHPPAAAGTEPTGFEFTAPSEPGFAVSEAPELGFDATEPSVTAPSPVSLSAPPTTAELPALGTADPHNVPGYRPSAIEPNPPPAPGPEIQISSSPDSARDLDDAVTVPPSRPSKEDLAALDALLNPSVTPPPASHPPSSTLNPSSSMRMRSSVPRPQPQSQRWEPQFRPPSAGSASGARRGRIPRRPVLPLVLAAVAIVAVAAAGYYFLFVSVPSAGPVASSRRPSPAPTTLRAATPAPIATVAPTPVPTPSSPVSVAATAPPSTLPPTTAPPVKAPPVTAPPVTAAPVAASASGDARRLLRSGSFPEAARGFTSEVKRAGNRFSVQVLVACSGDTVQKALDNVPSSELFILPVSYRGKACYRLCWGLYESQDRAAAALLSLPDYFRQGGASPKVSPAASLLP